MITTQERMIKEAWPTPQEHRARLLPLRKQVTQAYWKAMQATTDEEIRQAIQERYQAFCDHESTAGLSSKLLLESLRRAFEGYAAGVCRKEDDQLITHHKNLFGSFCGIKAERY